MAFKRILAVIAVATLGLIETMSQAAAAPAFQLNITSGTYNTNFNGTLNNVASGALTINGGGTNKFTFTNVEGTFSQTSHGFDMNLAGLVVKHTGSGTATITMALTYTGLTSTQVNAMESDLSSVVSSNANAQVSAAIYVSASNTAYGTDTTIVSYGAQGTAVNTITGAYTSPAALYSITEIVTITITGNNQATFADLHFQAVPEPTSLALLGMGLLGAGVSLRRRRQKAKETV